MIHWFKPSTENDKRAFSGAVRKIFEDGKNNIWIGCDKDGVYRLDQETNGFIPHKLSGYRKDFRPKNMYDIYEDMQGSLWIGTEGLYKRKKDSPEPNSFYLDTSNYFAKYTTISRIVNDHSGNLWIASIRGALLRQPEAYRGTGTFFEYKHNPSDPTSLSNSHVWSVYADDFGEVWVGTNHGLNRYVPEDDCFERYLEDLESSESFIYDMIRDKNGYLWLTTERGLIGFDPSKREHEPASSSEIKHYLAFEDIFPYRFYQDNEGVIYVGSKPGSGNGYFSFSPDDITTNEFIPPIVLTSFKIRNELHETDSSITVKQHLKLKHNQNFFSFEFAALDYTNPDQNRYAYMLEGMDDDWIYSGNRRFANYTRVPPGKYVFRIKGSNSDGFWNETGAFVSITVLPPPWKTWWAYLLYGVIYHSSILFHYPGIISKDSSFFINWLLNRFKPKSWKSWTELSPAFLPIYLMSSVLLSP